MLARLFSITIGLLLGILAVLAVIGIALQVVKSDNGYVLFGIFFIALVSLTAGKKLIELGFS